MISITVTDAGFDNLFDTDDDRSITKSMTVQVVSVLNAWRNPALPLDVDGDGEVFARDALFIINDINQNGVRTLPTRSSAQVPYLDVNGDGRIEPIDALLVINEINRRSDLANEGESAWDAQVDTVFAHEEVAARSQEQSTDMSWLWERKRKYGRVQKHTC